MSEPMVGGLGREKKADKEIQAACDGLKKEILEKAGKDGTEMFKALKYKSQVVAGTNYFVKIQVHPGGECVHARIFSPLPSKGGKTKYELNGVQTGKKIDQPVEYF
ncbi:hypothetical protein DPMN_051146 [Dreissena polymorpha]|nr:hypothetical protein DPMN_051146 [Dreissena polymorpha]